MRRRRFLEVSGAALSASALPRDASGAPSPRAQPRVRRGAASNVVVVGGGAFGSWTSFYLQNRGVPTLLVDAYGPGNPRSTSGGDTRGIRAAYGDREVYTRWAIEALARWKAWDEEWKANLLIPTGRISMAPSLTDSMRAAKAILDRNGVENEMLDHDEFAYRYPQINPEGVEVCHFEPTAATVRAARACRVVADEFQKLGGELRIARVTPGESNGSRLGSLTLADGSAIVAESFVFACGPWLPRLFPELLEDRIATPRRDVFYFGTPAGDERFGWPHLPNFSEGSQNVYGFPSVDYRGLKVAPTGGSVRFNPDTDERIVVGYQIKRAREYLALRFPDLKDQPVIESRVCQLEDTPDENFVIDRHPRWENVWLTGGGTGHAFKHGPVLGDYIAARVLGEETDAELDGLFAL